MFYVSFFRCLEHVVNLANVAVMGHITKIAVIENTNAIWEYDPELPNNCVPTLARIALDILPIPASSVPCERLFSAAKEVADDFHSCLGSKKFEELQIMKFAWRNTVPDLAAWNSNEVEEINTSIIGKYKALLNNDNWQADFNNNLDCLGSVIELM